MSAWRPRTDEEEKAFQELRRLNSKLSNPSPYRPYQPPSQPPDKLPGQATGQAGLGQLFGCCAYGGDNLRADWDFSSGDYHRG